MGQTRSGDSGGRQGAWGAVARLLSLQLLTVIAVTAVITGIYALTGPHKNHQATAGRHPTGDHDHDEHRDHEQASREHRIRQHPIRQPAGKHDRSRKSPASQPPPVAAHRLKVDVLNQSGPGGTAAKTASRVRALGWTVGRVSNFRGTVSATTVYYPTGQAKAARELARGLPGKPRVFPRFSTLASNRLTIIVTR